MLPCEIPLGFLSALGVILYSCCFARIHPTALSLQIYQGVNASSLLKGVPSRLLFLACFDITINVPGTVPPFLLVLSSICDEGITRWSSLFSNEISCSCSFSFFLV